MSFHKILCPTDYSEGSREGLRVASQLAAESDGQLVIVHVWHAPSTYTPDMAFSPDTIETLRRDAEASLAVWKSEAEANGARHVSTRFITGTAWHELVELIERDREIDLVVMGTHGRTGLQHVLLGSVAEKVVRHAACPVLVVRAPRLPHA